MATRALLLATILAIAFHGPRTRAAEPEPALEPGWVSLFNGKDLTGWRQGARDVLDGKTATPEGRFSVADGAIVVHEGKGGGVLSTTREFNGNFHLQLQFRAAPRADSGVFLRGVQLQVRDYPHAGPYKTVSFKDGGWNDLDVTVTNNVLTASLNGKTLTDADHLQLDLKGGQPGARLNGQAVPLTSLQVAVGPAALCRCNGAVIEKALKVGAKGGIGLQAEVGKFEYRCLRLKELP